MPDVIAVVADPGLATVQDHGRRGWTTVGVPVSGAWHRGRHRACVRLVDGSDGSAIELLAGHLSLEFERSTTLAVVGPAQVQVDGRSAPIGASIDVVAGSVVSVTHTGAGPVYVTVAGWTPARVLGSASADTFSGLGGGPLARGDVLVGDPTGHPGAGAFVRDDEVDTASVRVMVREEGDWLSGPWHVTTSARSGTRLRGGRVDSLAAMPSMPVVVGAIQATPDAELVILGPDGGLTGGYPVVGVVVTADLDLISVRAPGDPVRFAAVTVEQAADAHRVRRQAGAVVRPDGLGQAGGVVPG